MSIDVSFDLTEINRLAASLDVLALSSAPLARTVVRKCTLDGEAEAKVFAPVDTGNLRSSIGSEFRGNAFYSEGIFGPTASYGHYVEGGTSRMAPHAYVGPAFDRQQPVFVEAMIAIAGRSL